MKREFLEGLNLEKEVIDQIMASGGCGQKVGFPKGSERS